MKLFSSLPSNEPRHVFFVQTTERSEIETGRLAVSTPVHNVVYEPFPDSDWAQLDQLCQHYFDPVVRKFSQLSAADFSVPPAPPLYVPPTLVRRTTETERTPEVLAWSIELGQEELIGAKELSVKSRTLIIGRPGSGKTVLLRKAAAEVPEDEQPVYIRLSGVGEALGDAVGVLINWGRTSQSPGADRELTPDDLEAQRFHFLLDGLDEVPSGRQALIADRISDMARALPQHRFTVTSRPVEAVNSFHVGEWEFLELITTAEWRKAFLRRAGVDEEQLLDAVPALADLDDLLNLPFFLDAVVGLYQAGQLPAGADLLMNILAALIDGALAAPDIAPLRQAVRPWLRDVALTMHIAGMTSLSTEQLSRIELPPGPNIGPEDDVIDLLIRRSLLERSGGEIRFVHRLVADALTAEKLVEIGPTSGVLDVVAPSNEQVSGVRSDWMLVLVLAGSVSPTWRAAIAERDALTAARMVPSTADVAERREAALTIWRSHVRSRVWMHNRDGARVLRDDEIVGQLLRSGDLPDVVDEILGGFRSESPQVRSNTLEVLASARMDAELEPLVRVTLAGEREEVVRRQAVGAASRRNLVSAFPLIERRALSSNDDLELQTLVALGLRLAPEDQLVDFALALIEAGRARHWVVDRVVLDRLGAEAALIVTLAQAERGEHSPLRSRVLKDLDAELPDTDDVAERLAYIVASGQDLDTVKSRLLARPEAAMRGLVRALNERSRRWFEVAPVIALFPVELLDQVEFKDGQLKELLKRALTPRGEPNAVQGIEPEPSDEEPGPPEKLSELLRCTESKVEAQLLQRCLELAPEVKELAPAEKLELERLVERWWPEDSFAASITGNRITWRAHACLAYGSQLNVSLTDEEWVDVAGFGMPYEGKPEWLRSRYRRRAALLATTWRDDRAERWANLCDVIPGKLPPAVVGAIAEHVKTADPFLSRLLGRLLEERKMAALRKLASVPGGVGESADYYLARAGNVPAQKRCMTRLLQDFGTAKAIHSGDLWWMEGIGDDQLLARLFVALVRSYNHTNTDYNDSMTPVHEAIRRIGGVNAIERYDELMREEPPPFPGVQFERYQRDAIVDDMLRAAGDAATKPLLAALSLPVL